MAHRIAVVTGAGAGIGRATARALGRAGFDVALLGRNEERLAAAAEELEQSGVRTVRVAVDVADEAALDAAAERVEDELGPISIWVNCAGSTVVGPVAELDGADIRRATEVTYLGSVYGSTAALRRMRRRGQGVIVNLALGPRLRGLPLQAAENGARSAVVGFCESLRAEIAHDGDRIRVVLVHLPSFNTPRFGWTKNLTGKRLRPPAPIFEPEVAGEAICRAAFHNGEDMWVGLRGQITRAIDALAPRIVASRRARRGYAAQLEKAAASDDAPANLEHSVAGALSAYGPFDIESKKATALTPAFLGAPLPLGARLGLATLGLVGVLAGVWGARKFKI
ncbi:oxidoreductase [Acetobacter nitrogenifigens DSM 23921 = NBRC 105050]|uniref:Short-chain dehydrogenase n=1 Tax=Acetobacter nitrogenifigens DSM 23921 = NBRC 105050 TaxID=1120919 RepID=A0A511XC22_9PROT|nr:SDR family oxidoreductase [Acetobacter nitrogenifigens]GBQ88500.1 oxidoreductase [Acetobacter nitrogenifigens DSM 23921 = NBRC 105050]GEN60421.1 short-chain dehydrogenase [Acetobacter nitrogenifigens DSM 23921 = NBRC 105050]